MFSGIGLRTKLLILILPLTIVVIGISGVLGSLEAQAAITRIATRHLSYKAEQLRDFIGSEWEIISDLDLDSYPEYIQAAEQSLRTYAESMLRSPSELILAVDSAGIITMIAGQELQPSQYIGTTTTDPELLTPGWFSGELLDQSRVGIVFDLPAFDWTVTITEHETEFFMETRAIARLYLTILVAAVATMTILIGIFISYITQPIRRLTRTVERVRETNDLSIRTDVEFSDEIGTLAQEFNIMVSSLQNNYSQLEKVMIAERRARINIDAQEKETLLLLSRAAEYRDQDTGDHQRRIGELAETFARLLGMGENLQQLLLYSAPLHDIGKIAVSDNILLKPGKLTRQEFEIVKRHTSLGFELLRDSRSEYLIKGAQIALTHHEKWDGTGYPQGLSSDAIPLAGRIVGLLDVFDALISPRPYKAAWSIEQALDYIVKERGKHFDPALVDIFFKHFDHFQP